MTGRVWRLRPFHASACVMLAALMVSGAAVAETTLLSHFEPISVGSISDFFHSDLWLYDQVVYPVTVPVGPASTYGNLPFTPYEVIAYSNGLNHLSQGPGALGSTRGLRIGDGTASSETQVVFQFARINYGTDTNDASNPITFLDDTVVAENTDAEVRDWSDYSWLSFFLYVDSMSDQDIRNVKIKVQEYHQGRVADPGPPVVIEDLERAVWETRLWEVVNEGYGPKTGVDYSGWQHWLVPLPGGPVTWNQVTTNPDGTDTYDMDGQFTRTPDSNGNGGVRALIFEKPNNTSYTPPADYTLVVDEIALTRRCNARIARVFPARGFVRRAGLCYQAIKSGPPPSNRADVTLRTTNPLALLTTFGVTLETGPSPPEDRPRVVGSPQGHYMSEMGVSIWNEATDDWRQPQTLILRWPSGMPERRGYLGSDGDPDPKHTLYTDRRYRANLDPIPSATSGYLSTMYEASDSNPDNRRVAFTLFILPKGEDSDGDITVGQGDCVDVLIEAQPRPQLWSGGPKRLWKRTAFGIP